MPVRWTQIPVLDPAIASDRQGGYEGRSNGAAAGGHLGEMCRCDPDDTRHMRMSAALFGQVVSEVHSP
jgi:hypothetical protein